MALHKDKGRTEQFLIDTFPCPFSPYSVIKNNFAPQAVSPALCVVIPGQTQIPLGEIHCPCAASEIQTNYFSSLSYQGKGNVFSDLSKYDVRTFPFWDGSLIRQFRDIWLQGSWQGPQFLHLPLNK